MVAGCLDLYECGGGLEWLQWALKLQATMDQLFADKEKGVACFFHLRLLAAIQ